MQYLKISRKYANPSSITMNELRLYQTPNILFENKDAAEVSAPAGKTSNYEA